MERAINEQGHSFTLLYQLQVIFPRVSLNLSDIPLTLALCPCLHAATSVVPVPINGSNTVLPLPLRKQSSNLETSISGKTAGCRKDLSPPFLAIDQIEIEFLSHSLPSRSLALFLVNMVLAICLFHSPWIDCTIPKNVCSIEPLYTLKT